MKNNQGFFYDFIQSRPNPSLDRKKDKYYCEMQVLAYNLVRYLKMNDDPNEHSCQGNYNLTYICENMTGDDFRFVASRFLRRMNLGELKTLIKEYFSESTQGMLLDTIDKDNEIEDYFKFYSIHNDNIIYTAKREGKSYVVMWNINKYADCHIYDIDEVKQYLSKKIWIKTK